jgi:hypothetical protein
VRRVRVVHDNARALAPAGRSITAASPPPPPSSVWARPVRTPHYGARSEEPDARRGLRRAARIVVESYDVALDVTGDETHFESTSTVRFRAEAGDTFVELDGELLSAELDRGEVGRLEGNRLALSGLSGDHVLTVRGRYAYSRTGEGLHRAVDPADGLVYLWAMSFLDDAQRIFACFDQPDLKATIRLTVDAPAGCTVVANTRGRRDGDRWTFEPTERWRRTASPWRSGPGTACTPRTAACGSACTAGGRWRRTSRRTPPSCSR